MKEIKSINELSELNYAISDILGYLTDNSCGDPECCGGPYYEKEEYDNGINLLKAYGLDATNASIEPE